MSCFPYDDLIVGADKGGVGKTMTSRAVWISPQISKINVRAFDCQMPRGDLDRFAAGVERLDIAETTNQMKVFDGVSLDAVTLIDLAGGQLSPTLQLLADAKLLDAVRNNEMGLLLAHVIGPSMSSIAEIGDLAERVTGGSVRHFLVKNHINDTKFFEWDTETAKAEWLQMRDFTIELPRLDAVACEKVQLIGGSFLDFAVKKGVSPLLRGLVSTWQEKAFAEFDRVKLRQAIIGG